MRNIFFVTSHEKTLIFDSLNGCGAVFSSEINQHLITEGQNVIGYSKSIPHALTKYLKDKNLFECKNLDSSIKYRNFRLEEAKKGNLISSIRITLTKKCNCICEYCYVERDYKNNAFLSSADCLSFISKIIEKNRRKKYLIRFFGGEPTLAFSTIKNLIEKLNHYYPEISFEYIINTNLQCTTKEMLSFFKTNNFKVVVSLDGIKENNDINRHSLISNSYFDQTVKNIEKLNNLSINYVVAAVVTTKNRNQLNRFLFTMKELGVKNIGLNCVKMSANMLLYDEELANILFASFLWGEENGIAVSGYWYLPFERIVTGSDYAFCGGLGYELDLRPDLSIYSCVGIKEPIGTLDDFESVFQNPLYLDLVSRISPFINECNGCFIQGLCAGECACNAKYKTGKYMSIDDSQCDFLRSITMKLILHYLNKKG